MPITIFQSECSQNGLTLSGIDPDPFRGTGRQWTTESHFPCHFQSRSSVPAAPTLVLEPSGREGAPGLGDRTEGRVSDAIGTSHADVARHCRFHIQSPHVVLLN